MGKDTHFFKKHPIIKTLCLIFIISILLVILTLYGIRLYTRHGKAVLIPEVTQLDMVDAMHILEREGFRYEVVDSMFIDEATPGSIIDQLPAAGSKVKEGRKIYLTVNAYSPRTIACPKVADMSLRQAISTLEGVGLSHITVKHIPSEYPDLVIGVEYRDVLLVPGDRIPAGASIVLLVGDGSDEITATSFENETPTIATASPTEEIVTDEEWF